MNWATRHSGNFPQQRIPYTGSRPLYRTPDRRRREHRRRYRRPYPGFGYVGYRPYAYTNSWELIPWDLGSPDLSNDDDGGGEQVQPPYYEEQPPSPEDRGYRPDYVSPTPYQSPRSREVAPTPPQDEPQLTLVFRDGHTQAIHNYVLTPREILVIDDVASGKTQRIAVAALNLLATKQSARRDGLDFALPAF
jgi:hypothetical protein